LAHQLRASLWAEHLNTSPSFVADPIQSAGLWLAPPTGARIKPYDPFAGTDKLSPMSWDQVIDPPAP
jgi:hypothetical protein